MSPKPEILRIPSASSAQVRPSPQVPELGFSSAEKRFSSSVSSGSTICSAVSAKPTGPTASNMQRHSSALMILFDIGRPFPSYFFTIISFHSLHDNVRGSLHNAQFFGIILVEPADYRKTASQKAKRFSFMLALPIFPASHPASIVGADELNFCVRDGNRWTLVAINTNLWCAFRDSNPGPTD